MFQKYEFCEKLCSKNVNFVKIQSQKNMNFVNKIFEM